MFVITKYKSNGDRYDFISNEHPIEIVDNLKEVQTLVDKEKSTLVKVEEGHYLREKGCKYTFKEKTHSPKIFACPYDKTYVKDCISENSQRCLNYKKTSEVIEGSVEEAIFLECLRDQERFYDRSWAEYRVYEV